MIVVTVAAVTELDVFLDALPKVELHLHLVGSASPRTVLELATLHPGNRLPATEAGLREFFEFRDFPHFAKVYDAVTDVVRDPADVAALVTGAARDLTAHNVRYAELTVTAYSHVIRGMPMPAVTEALDVAARDSLANHGVQIAYIFDIPGEFGEEAARLTLEHALEHPPAALVGFGLAGIEQDRMAHRDAFRQAFRAAVAAGLHSVPHAGETTGPETIWESLQGLRAERIGHGIRCLDDPRLVAHLRDHRIPLEVCPTSNVRTRQVTDLASHPFPRLRAEGLVLTVNSDDPPMFDTTLTGEYRALATTFDLDRSALTELAANAVRASFLDEPAKRELLALQLAAVRKADSV